jgi:serine/threonine-protein kinase HipA
LKPAIGVLPNGIDLSNSVMNEYLCLRLCEFFGLPIAEAEIVDIAGTTCLVVKRFDRQWSADGKRILRLPQEDLCQALGLSGSQKYEDQGGPGFTDCMKLLMASDHALQDREIFLRTQLVFFLLGATDGHAKNFSIFLNPDGFRMTPLYDVLSAEPAMQARQIRWSKFRMSMCFGRGRHYQIRRLTFRHFEESCALAGMDLQTLYEVTTDLMARIQDLEGFAASLGKKIERRLLQSVLDGISRRATLFR